MLSAHLTPMHPAVSIIVPCYNQEKYIVECLESVIAQPFKDWEIIVINDGSSDNSRTILEHYIAGRADKIRLINQDNSGVIAARNAGLTAARGEYIFPLDGDDKMAPDCLGKLYEAIQQGLGDVVYGDTVYFGAMSGKMELSEPTRLNMIMGNCVPCSALYRKTDALKYGGYDANMRKGLEDWEFWLNFVCDKKKFYRLPTNVLQYRILPMSRNRSFSRHDYESLLSYMKNKHRQLFSWRPLVKFWKFIYNKKTTQNGRCIVKFCKIPVYFFKPSPPSMTPSLLKIARLAWLQLFAKKRESRREYRDMYRKLLIERKRTKSKWGVSYSVFDGEELLEASIRNMRPHVDYINVVWQKVSWYGAPANEGLYPQLLQLKEEGLIDELIEYEVNLKLKAGKNETLKRNKGLQAARRAGVTHYMTMDTDEFYLSEDIETSKDWILKMDITHSYCAQATYGKKPTDLLLEYRCNCQYFSRLTKWSKHLNDKHSIALVDPTRKLSHTPWWLGGSKHYFLHNVRMHHYTHIRKNIRRKYENSSFHGGDHNCIPSHDIDETKILKCPDYFNLEQVIEKF